MSVPVEDAGQVVTVALTALSACLSFAIFGVFLAALMLWVATLVDRSRTKVLSGRRSTGSMQTPGR